VAVLVGLLDGEELTGWIVGGIAIILAGVALVRGGHRGRSLPRPEALGREPLVCADRPLVCGARRNDEATATATKAR
jgi:hypothetical protein